MRSPWSRFSILLLPDPGLVLRLRSSDSLISGETATFQSYRSSLAHLSSIGNTKHLFVLTKISGDVPDVPSTPSRLFVGRGCCQLVHAPTIALHLWTSHQAQKGSTLYHPVQWLQKTVTDQKDAETHKYCCYPLTRSLGRTILAWAGGLRERCRARECY